MKPSPVPSFKVTQSKFLLQFLVVALDAPTQLRRTHQLAHAARRREVGEPVLGRLLLCLGPLDQQPLFVARLAALVVPMCDADAQGGEAGMHRAASSFAPTHAAQVARTQTQGQFFDRKRLMSLIPPEQFRWTSHDATHLGRERNEARRPDRSR